MYEFDRLVLRDGLYYQKFTDTPFSGNVTGDHQGKIINGKKEGEWLEFYSNGALSKKINYRDKEFLN